MMNVYLLSIQLMLRLVLLPLATFAMILSCKFLYLKVMMNLRDKRVFITLSEFWACS